MDPTQANVLMNLPPLPEGNAQSILDAYGLEYTPDGQYIRWSVSNKKHPRNWNMPQKIYDSSVIIFLDLFTYVLLLLWVTTGYWPLSNARFPPTVRQLARPV